MEDTELVELVIKIPYGVYKKALAIKGTDEELCFEDRLQLEVGIENGKMLPKGHDDLFDKSKIKSVELEDSLHILRWEQGSEIDLSIDADTIIPADR